MNRNRSAGSGASQPTSPAHFDPIPGALDPAQSDERPGAHDAGSGPARCAGGNLTFRPGRSVCTRPYGLPFMRPVWTGVPVCVPGRWPARRSSSRVSLLSVPAIWCWRHRCVTAPGSALGGRPGTRRTADRRHPDPGDPHPATVQDQRSSLFLAPGFQLAATKSRPPYGEDRGRIGTGEDTVTCHARRSTR